MSKDNEVVSPQDVFYRLLQDGDITLEEYLKGLDILKEKEK